MSITFDGKPAISPTQIMRIEAARLAETERLRKQIASMQVDIDRLDREIANCNLQRRGR